jgi:hypothetical protein
VLWLRAAVLCKHSEHSSSQIDAAAATAPLAVAVLPPACARMCQSPQATGPAAHKSAAVEAGISTHAMRPALAAHILHTNRTMHPTQLCTQLVHSCMMYPAQLCNDCFHPCCQCSKYCLLHRRRPSNAAAQVVQHPKLPPPLPWLNDRRCGGA